MMPVGSRVNDQILANVITVHAVYYRTMCLDAEHNRYAPNEGGFLWSALNFMLHNMATYLT